MPTFTFLLTVALCLHTDCKPTLPVLTDFPGKTQHFNIAERIGGKYLSVGTGLLHDERGDVVPAIVSEHGRNAEQINMDILSRWVQGKGIADRTWQGLLGVLRVHCPGLAQDIEETLIAETDDSFSSPPQQESPFNKKLRDWYAERPLPYYFDPRCYKWMPNVSKKYIHPDIISKDEQEKQMDSQKEALLREERWRITEKRSDIIHAEEDSSDTEDGSINTVELEDLLKAGSGETCKCILVEGSPGMGKSTLAWQVCHRWGRRELIEQYSTVLLLPLRDNEVQQAKQVEDLIDLRNVEIGDTLVILDGLDELPGHLLSKRSIFTDLLSGKVLGDATIMVTSRPSATQQLLKYWKQRVSKHYVIRGFNEDDIGEYTKSVLPNKTLTEFQQQLSIHPHIQSIMYVPLHSAIVMAVYLQHKQLPKTLTELYKALVKTILSQYLDDHSEYGNPDYCGGEDVSSDIIGLKVPKAVHSHFRDLCKIAFDTLSRQELIFTDKIMPKELHNLGFTDSVPGLYMCRTCSYNFLHLSIQEFLAAYYVSHCNHLVIGLACKVIREENPDHYENMTKFVVGLLSEIVGLDFINNDKNGVVYLDGHMLELLYENQDMSVLGKENTYYAKLDHSQSLQSHYWFTLGSNIANSKCSWGLALPSLCSQNMQMLAQGLHDCETQPAYTIKSIESEEVTDEVVGTLLSQAPAYFIAQIERLSIISGSYDHKLTTFCQWLPTCRLKTLSLGVQPHLIEMVSRTLNAVPSLKTLNMSGSKFTIQSTKAFASMLKQNQSLTEVIISWCSIDTDCACRLARALHKNTRLTELDIGMNSVGEWGAVAIAQKLKHNTALTELDMSWNSVGERGALAMAKMLKHNAALQTLYMYDDTIGVKGAKVIS